MARYKTKRELLAIINKADLLEAVVHEIVKTTTPSSKKSELNKYVNEATAYIDDQRQVLLIAIKVR